MVSRSFDDYLLDQLAMLDVSADVLRAAQAVVGSLDDDGFFLGSPEEIAALAGASAETAREGLRIVQLLDPPGVGARNLAEALSIQMEYLELEEPLLERIVQNHLDDIAANHFRKVARALRVDEGEVRRVVEILESLNPRPAGAFSPGPSPGYIVPDVTLRRFGDDWLITANNEAIPTLKVSPRYRAMLRTGSEADDETRRYLKDKIRSAESLHPERRSSQGHGQPNHPDHSGSPAGLLRGRQRASTSIASGRRRHRDRRASLHRSVEA